MRTGSYRAAPVRCRFGEALFSSAPAALVGRAGEAGVSGDRALTAQVARERFMAEHIRCLNAEAIDPTQLQNLGVRPLLRRLFRLFQTRRLDLLDRHRLSWLTTSGSSYATAARFPTRAAER